MATMFLAGQEIVEREYALRIARQQLSWRTPVAACAFGKWGKNNIYEGERRRPLRMFGATLLQPLQKLNLARVIDVVKRNSEDAGDDRTSSRAGPMQNVRVGGCN